ncbi:MAG: transcription termination/antitermination protein NusA [Anaerolineae bacterium]|nr:MAG: transcription termination/antitermination protein NusA [Anaerolineae bacterium]
MKNEFIIALSQLCSERSLPPNVVLETIEVALVSAYKRRAGPHPNIVAKIDADTGKSFVYKEKLIVEEVEDERLQITLDEARQYDAEVGLGETILIDCTPRDFGRIAAQTAKQVMLQRIREAERDALFVTFAQREGELINGTVQSISAQGVTLNLGRTEATLPRNQQIPGERYRINQRVRAYVLEVRKSNRGPQIIVSRSHRNMLRRLLELEVPEIFNGAVEIKAIAREAGSRSKVAVAAVQEGVDPVGSCVGMRGIRIQNIVNEMSGEKVDVVAWDADTATFIANALSPARVSNVLLDDSSGRSKTATVIVPDDQLSLSIGKEGQNARLAAKLTGWRIDIKSVSEAAEEAKRQEKERQRRAALESQDLLAVAKAILMGKDLDELAASGTLEDLELSTRVVNALKNNDVQSVQQLINLAASGEDALLGLAGVGPKAVEEIMAALEAARPEEAVETEAIAETAAEKEAALEPATEQPAGPEALVADKPAVEKAPAKVQEEPSPEKAAPKVVDVVEGTLDIPVVADWSEEEEDDEDRQDSKKLAKKKKQRLEYDEALGEVVKRRKRKPGRSREVWEDPN